MGDRNIPVGGNLEGTAVVTGDHTTANVHYRKMMLPPAESVDIHSELAALQTLLVGLTTEARPKIANALAEATADAAKPHPDKNEIGKALERAPEYASKAADFSEKAGKIAPHVQNAIVWLGDHWHKLRPLVGLAV